MYKTTWPHAYLIPSATLIIAIDNNIGKNDCENNSDSHIFVKNVKERKKCEKIMLCEADSRGTRRKRMEM